MLYLPILYFLITPFSALQTLLSTLGSFIANVLFFSSLFYPSFTYAFLGNSFYI